MQNVTLPQWPTWLQLRGEGEQSGGVGVGGREDCGGRPGKIRPTGTQHQKASLATQTRQAASELVLPGPYSVDIISLFAARMVIPVLGSTSKKVTC